MGLLDYARIGNNGNGRGLGIQLIIGLIIAAVGAIGYYSHTSVNPVTGETQHVGNITEQQETAMGLQAAPEMIHEMGGEVQQDDPAARWVNYVGTRVHDNSDASKSPYHYQFHLLNDHQTINAFALPGGQVFITRALFDKLSTEAELAGVLGHEITHVVERHSAQQMAKQGLTQSLVMATGVAASGNSNHPGEGQAVMVAASAAANLMNLSYSRKDESEADAGGLRWMTQAAYDPQGCTR